MSKVSEQSIIPKSKAPVGTELGRKVHLTRYRWRRFSPSGVQRGIGFYIKMAYGLLGASFLLFTALSSMDEPDMAPDKSLPPTAWYMRWLDISSGSEQASEESVSPFDDLSPFAKDALDEDKSETSERSIATWGSDRWHNNLRALLGQGAMKYLTSGAIAGILAALFGLLGAISSEWIKRPQLPLPYVPETWRQLASQVGGSLFHLADHIPKLLLLLIIYGGFGSLNETTFTVAMAIFLSFGPANLFRERLRAYLSSEQYIYAVEIGLSPWRILFRHFLRRQVLPLLKVQMPLLLSLYVMYEATLDFFNLSSGSADSWGRLISKNAPNISWGSVADGVSTLAAEMPNSWAFLVPLVSLLFVVSSLYVLGDALREGSIAEHS